jgi:hypothetical protein
MFKIQVEDSIVSIDVAAPDEAGKIECSDLALMATLSNTFGLHTTLGESASPEALEAAVKKLGLKYEIIEGADILDMPIQPMPDGAIP